jgi:hypothetical protein
MAKNDADLFARLRAAGLRKQVAKRLSGIGEGAGKQATRAARGAASELRALADEIERRLPRDGAAASPTSTATPATPVAVTVTRRSTRTTARTPRRAATRRNGAPVTKPAATSTATRAPRGQNKAKILASLGSGPKTASQIAGETGIGARTVGSTLTKLAGTGEVVKAPRGYALPQSPARRRRTTTRT